MSAPDAEEKPWRKLKAILAETISTTAGVPTGIVLCVDGSGSVSDEDFQRAIKGCCVLARNYADQVLVGVVQFSSTVTRVAALSKDRNALVTQVEAMKQLKCNTRTDLGLQEATKMLAQGSLKKKMIILFTDGAADNQAETVRVAKEAAQQGITIIGIGIGDVAKEQLDEICGEARSVVLEDYEQLLLVAGMPSLATAFVEGSKVDMIVTQLDLPASLKSNLKFAFELFNMGECDIPAGTIFRVYDAEKVYLDSFFKLPSQIEPRECGGKSLKFEVVVELKGTIKTIDHMPTRLFVELYDFKTKARYQLEANVIPLEVHNMWGDVAAWKPPSNLNYVNIATFGWKGAGKSTLLNRIMETVTAEEGLQPCHAMAAADHVTTRLSSKAWKELELQDHDEAMLWAHKLNKINVKFVDVPGIDDGEECKMWMDPDQVRRLLQGAIHPDWKLGAEMFGEPDPTREVHAIIFVIPAGAIDNFENRGPVGRLIKNFVSEHDRKPIIAVTQTDLYPTDQHPHVIQEVKGMTGCDNVFMIDNKASKSFETSKAYYKLLWAALSTAGQYIRSRDA